MTLLSIKDLRTIHFDSYTVDIIPCFGFKELNQVEGRTIIFLQFWAWFTHI